MPGRLPRRTRAVLAALRGPTARVWVGRVRDFVLGRPPPRPDPYELAAQRMDATRRARGQGQLAEPPPRLGRPGPARPPWRPLLLIVAVILLGGIVRATLQNRTPSLATNCQTAALRLSVLSIADNQPIHWAATGPASGEYLLAIGEKGFVGNRKNQLVPVPSPGTPDAQTQGASLPFRLGGCKASGVFDAVVPAGDYVVDMFRLFGSGVTTTSRVVATAPLVVTSH